MLSDAVTRILSAGLIVIFNAATVIQSVLWIIMYPTVSCPTLSCQLLQKNVSHNLTNLRVHLRLGRLSPCCVEWHYGTVSRDKLWPGFPTQSCKRWRLKTIPQYNLSCPRSSLGAKMVNRVFSLTWPASMEIYWNKRKRLHKKGVQLPEDWFGTPTWPPFHCFGTPIWPPWRHVKTLYRPFARDGHMVQKTPCWKVNNAVVPWKERILAIWMMSSLCF